jgi:hypothetical protein
MSDLGTGDRNAKPAIAARRADEIPGEQTVHRRTPQIRYIFNAKTRIMRRVCAVFLLLSLYAGVASAGAIVGRVLEDHSGAALPSAEIRVSRDGSSDLVADLETNLNGSFEIPDLAAGTYRLEVSKANYLPTTLAVRAGKGASISLVARLIRCAVISGRVLDSDGKAVPSATVFAMSRPSDAYPMRPFAGFERGHESRVHENGEYRLFNLPPGQYAVAVSYGASTVMVGSTGASQAGPVGSGTLYYPVNSQPRLFLVSGGEEYRDVDFSIAPNALFRISGKIDLAAPQPGFWLALTSQSEPTLATAMTEAGKEGSFSFEGIPPGSYFLFASGPSHGRGPLGMMVDDHSLFGRMPVEVGGDVDGLAVTVSQGRSTSLVLRNSNPGDHACSGSMEFRISSLEDWGADLDRTVVVGFGKPVASGHLAPGRYLLTAQDAGSDCYTIGDTLLNLAAAAGDGPIAIPVAPKGSLHGTLAVGRDQAVNWTIILLPARGGDVPLKAAFPDLEGRFAFDRLRPGRYRIAARLSNDPSRRWVPESNDMTEIEVKPGAVIQVELPSPASGQSAKE